MQRICRAAIQYAGRNVAVGDVFEVEDQHIDLLLKTGHIEVDAPEHGYVSRDMTAESPPEYRTREMVKRKRGRPRKVAL